MIIRLYTYSNSFAIVADEIIYSVKNLDTAFDLITSILENTTFVSEEVSIIKKMPKKELKRYNISISKPETNKYKAHVGCLSFEWTTLEAALTELSAYIKDPENVEKLYI